MKVLLIEDNPGDARLIGEMLKEARETAPQLAECLADGIERARKEEGAEIALLDLNLPDSQGIGTFEKLQAAAPRLPVIVLTGLQDDSLSTEAMRKGAQDYLVKGHIDAEMLTRSLRYAIERKRLDTIARRRENEFRTLVENSPDSIIRVSRQLRCMYMNPAADRICGVPTGKNDGGETGAGARTCPGLAMLLKPRFLTLFETGREETTECVLEGRHYHVRLVPEYGLHGEIESAMAIFHDITELKRIQEHLTRSYRKVEKTIGGIIEAIVKIVETRDPYTAGHEDRVAQLAVAIGGEMGLSRERLDGLWVAAAIHDIGKVYVPGEILSKPGSLSENEFRLIETHAEAGYHILRKIDFPWPVAQIAYQHQERFNGTGYPRRLCGDAILPEARILAVADTVEAMTYSRPYRPGAGLDRALEEIRCNKGVLYDPRVADSCLKLFRENKFNFDKDTNAAYSLSP
jgi:putative nucleotidyltransferase with HDIG domain